MALLTSDVGKCPKHLKYVDVQCPICLSILIEPVTLPCKHDLCMPCFKDTIDKVNLCCPLCRTRVSSWARKAARQNQLINKKKWTEIKKAFPQLVERRLKGLDDSLSQVQLKDNEPALNDTGEIKEEYEALQKKVVEEKLENEKKNEQKLWKFMKNEKKTWGHNSSVSLVSNEAITSSPTDSNKPSVVEKSATALPESKAKQNSELPDESFDEPEVITISSSQSSTPSIKRRSVSSASNDSISQELRHFKPIKTAPKTPPKPQPDGRVVEPPLVLTRPRVLREFSTSSTSSSIETCVPLRRKLKAISAERAANKRPRKEVDKEKKKNSDDSSSDEETKRIFPLEPDISIADQTSTYNPSEPSTSFAGKLLVKTPMAKNCVTSNKAFSSTQKKYLASLQDNTVVQLVEQQMVLMNKLKQEEADWKLAQKLQQRFDREMKSCRGNREPYFLRKRRFTAVPVMNGVQRRKHV